MGIKEIVGNDYETWQPGDLIFLFSGTGSGKTTLALENITVSYVKHDKKVLYLVPRVILKEQIENIIRGILNTYGYETPQYNEKFYIWTYKHLEKLLLENKKITSFDLIICDEFHYFVSDSTFNPYTQLSYNFIFNHNREIYDKRITLFLTATPDNIMYYITKNISFKSTLYHMLEKYNYDIDFEERKKYSDDSVDDIFNKSATSDYMKLEFKAENRLGVELNVYVYKLQQEYNYINIKYIIEDNEIIEIIKNAKEKTVVFVSSKKRGKILKENLKKDGINSDYITAENKNDEAKKAIKKLTEENTFPEKVLITTSVLDVGVNISSEYIENIIISTTEPMEFLQMLGRIRVQSGKKITLFIFKRSVKYFQKIKKGIIQKIKCCEYLESYRKYYDDENNKDNEDDTYKEKYYGDNLNEIFQEELKPMNNVPDGYKKFLYLDNDFAHKNKIKLNTLAPCYLRQLDTLYDVICKGLQEDENYFIKEQLKWLECEEDFSDKNFYSLELKENYIQDLQKAIESKAKESKNGVSLGDCGKILETFQPLIKKIDNNIKLSKPKFNKFCTEHNIPYKFTSEYNKVIRKHVYYLTEIDRKSQLIKKINSSSL